MSADHITGKHQMKFLHYEAELSTDDAFEVTLDKQANVRMLDDDNFAAYEMGHKHTYYGGWVEQSPVRLEAPHEGRWHLVVDLGGATGTVSAGVTVLQPTAV